MSLVSSLATPAADLISTTVFLASPTVFSDQTELVHVQTTTTSSRLVFVLHAPTVVSTVSDRTPTIVWHADLTLLFNRMVLANATTVTT